MSQHLRHSLSAPVPPGPIRLLGSDDSDNQFKISFDMLTVTLLISSVLYIFGIIAARRKLAFLHSISTELGTTKLLVLSAGLVCVVRTMTFFGIAIMNIANVRAHYSLNPTPHWKSGEKVDSSRPVEQNQAFYDASMTVLFDLPNAIVISTYILLTLVWAECFLGSRLHTESAVSWKVRWLSWYMAFNAALYATQMVLYILVFATSATIVRTILYAAMTGINFTAVFMVLILFVYLSVKFSGFPFRSPYAKESLSKISHVMLLWSLSRIAWGIEMLVVYIYNIELLEDSSSPWSFLVLFLMFVVFEILPIFALLDHALQNMINFEHGMDSHSYNQSEPFLPLSSEAVCLEEEQEEDSGAKQRAGWQNESHGLYGDQR